MSKLSCCTPVARDQVDASGGGVRIFARALDVVGKLWALPNSLIGLAFGALGHVIGRIENLAGRCDSEPRISLGNNAIQFENNPLVITAIALGNIIVYGQGKRYQPNASRHGGAHTLGVEEMHHTFQAQFLGPFYLPAHGVLGVAATLANGHWHGPLNVLEAGPHDEKPTASLIEWRLLERVRQVWRPHRP